MYEPWRVQLFGNLRARQRERTISRFRSQQTGALLAYLAYHRHSSHSREALIELLWPASDLESGRHSLSNALSSLRGQLEPPGAPAGSVIIADRYSVELNPDAVATDVAEFEQALRRAAQARTSSNYPRLLAEATERYSGPLLPDYYEDWIAAEQGRLLQRFQQTVTELVPILERQGEIGPALEVCRRSLFYDPLREETHRDVMRLLAATGQPEQAMRQYRDLQRLFADELGASLSMATQELARQIEAKLADRQPASVSSQAIVPSTSSPSSTSRSLPTGTVTFLLSDVEDFAALRQTVGEEIRAAVSAYQGIMRAEARRSGGQEVRATEDAMLFAFAGATDALNCALACRRALSDQPFPGSVGRLGVRMALHAGDADIEEGKYQGPILERADRLLLAGHGGQTLVSDSLAGLLRRDLAPGVVLTDLGMWRLSDGEEPDRVFQMDTPKLENQGFPPLKAAPTHTAHLPLRFTRFFGRTDEIEQIYALLRASEIRTLTLTGPGGTGKTRLAIEAAEKVSETFQGGIWFVPLADLSESDRIPDAILDSMGVPRDTAIAPLDQAAAALAKEPSLLILDNFEHLVRGGAQVLLSLLERAPSLRCLITSRQLLGLPGEREFAVPPLPTPQGADTPERLSLFESVQLFVDRAQASKPDFRVTTNNAAAVAELCERLEGLPLAIELAAARALVLTPLQMLGQLSRRFEFLVSRKSGVAERQRTLRAAVDWSYKLLTPGLQRFFVQLSVFRGGWTVEAAEAVCEEALALDYLAQLRDCSLIHTVETRQGMHFRMLESLREFGEVQFSDEERLALGRRHMEYFLALAEEAEPHLWRADQVVWHDRLESDFENLQTAFGWAEIHDPRAGLRLFGSLTIFWYNRAHSTPSWDRVLRMIDLIPSPSLERAKALWAGGRLAGGWAYQRERFEASLADYRELGNIQGIADLLLCLAAHFGEEMQYEKSRTYLDECLPLYRLLGDNRGIAGALGRQGLTKQALGDLEAAQTLHEQSLSILRVEGDQRGIANTLYNMGRVANLLGQHRVSHRRFEEMLRLARNLRHRRWMPSALANYAASLAELGDFSEAYRHFDDALAACDDIDDRNWRAQTLELYGFAVCKLGDTGRASSLLAEALSIRQERDPDSYPSVRILLGFAWIAVESGQFERAGRLLAGHNAFHSAAGVPRPAHLQRIYDRLYERCLTAVANDDWQQCWASGEAMTFDQAVAYALDKPAE